MVDPAAIRNPPEKEPSTQTLRNKRGRWKQGLFLGVIACLRLGAGYASSCRAGEDGGEEAQETLSIPLRGNPSTGYLWSWTASGEGAIRETDVGYEQDSGMLGSPVTYTYVFAGEREGDVVLRFVYSRSGPPSPDAPVNVYTIRVLPDKRVVLLDSREGDVGTP